MKVDPWQLVWGHVVHIKSGPEIEVEAVGVGADWQGAYFIKEDGGRHRYEFGGLPCESQSFINSEVGRFPESLCEAPTRQRLKARMLIDHFDLKTGDVVEVSSWAMIARCGRDLGKGFSGQRYASPSTALCRMAWVPDGLTVGYLNTEYFELVG